MIHCVIMLKHRSVGGQARVALVWKDVIVWSRNFGTKWSRLRRRARWVVRCCHYRLGGEMSESLGQGKAEFRRRELLSSLWTDSSNELSLIGRPALDKSFVLSSPSSRCRDSSSLLTLLSMHLGFSLFQAPYFDSLTSKHSTLCFFLSF